MPDQKFEYEPLNRMEVTIAEIFRLHMPSRLVDERGDLWIDMAEDVVAMFKTGKPRFNEEEFWCRCFGDPLKNPAQEAADKLGQTLAKLQSTPSDSKEV